MGRFLLTYFMGVFRSLVYLDLVTGIADMKQSNLDRGAKWSAGILVTIFVGASILSVVSSFDEAAQEGSSFDSSSAVEEQAVAQDLVNTEFGGVEIPSEAVGAAVIIKQQADYLLGPSLLGPGIGKR